MGMDETTVEKARVQETWRQMICFSDPYRINYIFVPVDFITLHIYIFNFNIFKNIYIVIQTSMLCL